MPLIPLLPLNKQLLHSIFMALRSTLLPVVHCAALIFFAGCGNQQATQALRLETAKHFDIPTPLGFTLAPKQTISSSSCDYMVSFGSLSVIRAAEFYRRELDKNGWNVDDYSTRDQGMIVATKPHKTCCISMRSEQGKTAIHVFVKPKDL